jgi:hypothetical protein
MARQTSKSSKEDIRIRQGRVDRGDIGSAGGNFTLPGFQDKPLAPQGQGWPERAIFWTGVFALSSEVSSSGGGLPGRSGLTVWNARINFGGAKILLFRVSDQSSRSER